MEPAAQKNFLFEVILPRVEWFAWLLAIAGVALAYFSYPKANICIFLGFSTLAAIYFLSSFAPSATAKTLPGKVDYKPVDSQEKSFLAQALAPYIQGQAIAVTLVGIQFKLLFLLGYNTLLVVGLSTIAAVLAIQAYTNTLSHKSLIILTLGTIMFYIPSDELVRQFYRRDPVLIEKMLYHLHYPKDKAAAEEVRRLQQARHGQ